MTFIASVKLVTKRHICTCSWLKFLLLILSEIEKETKKLNDIDTYLFVAAAFQDIHNPIMTNTKPCENVVEGSSR